MDEGVEDAMSSMAQVLDAASESDDTATTIMASSSEELGEGDVPPAGWGLVSLGAEAMCKVMAGRVVAAGKAAAMPDRRKRAYDNRKRGAKAAARARRGLQHKSFASNGKDLARIHKVLRGSCNCSKQCFQAVQCFLEAYWSWTRAEQDAFIVMGASHVPILDDGRPNVSKTVGFTWQFLGRPIGAKCLPRLLGHNQRHLLKALRGVPDLRCNRPPQSRPSRKAAMIHAFLLTMYHSVAETLPDNFVRKGHAAKRCDLDSDAEEDGMAVTSDLEEDDESLLTWLEGPGTTVAWSSLMTTQGLVRPDVLVRRWLPPGNLMELYQHFASVQEGQEEDIPSYATFARTWQQSGWHEVRVAKVSD